MDLKRGVFRTQSNIYDGSFLAVVNKIVAFMCEHFSEKAPLYIFDWVLNTPLLKMKLHRGIHRIHRSFDET